MKDMLYSLLNNSLPTICKVTHSTNHLCPTCSQSSDTIPHILVECPYAQSLWKWACSVYTRWKPNARFSNFTFQLWIHKLLSKTDTLEWIFWSIPVFKTLWLARCSKLYSDTTFSFNELCSRCISQWLSSALIMSNYYSPNLFHPIISVNPSSHSITWNGPSFNQPLSFPLSG